MLPHEHDESMHRGFLLGSGRDTFIRWVPVVLYLCLDLSMHFRSYFTDISVVTLRTRIVLILISL